MGATSRGIKFYLPLTLLMVVAAIYVNSLSNPFLLHDRVAIVQQDDVTKPGGWWRLWLSDDLTSAETGVLRYEPVTVLSYRLNAAITGYVPKPLSFRLVNMALLVSLGVLTAYWLSYMVHPAAAWLAALVLVAHPALGQSINQISGRDELLAVTAVVGFALLQRAAIQRGRWSVPRAVGAAGLAMVALGSSQTGLLVAPLAFVQQWIGPIHQPLPPPSGDRRKPRPVSTTVAESPIPPAQRARVGRLLFPILALPLLVFLLLRWQVLTSAPAPAGDMDLTANPMLSLGILQRIPAALSLAWFYAWQALWPALALPDVLHALRRPQEPLDMLMLSRSFNQIPVTLPTWLSADAILGMAMLLLAAGGLIPAAKRHASAALALTLALSQFLLVSHLFWPRADYASNQFLPPFALAAAMFLAVLIDRISGFSIRRRAVAALPCALTVLAMGVVGHLGNRHCISDAWVRRTDMAEQSAEENPVILYNYADALLSRPTAEGAEHRRDRAIDLLEKAVTRRPESAQIHRQLAQAYAYRGDTAEATEHFLKVIALRPRDPTACRWFDSHSGPPR